MNKEWKRSSPKSFKLDWRPLFIEPAERLWQIEEAIRTDGGWVRKNFRFKQNINKINSDQPDGAVCLAVRAIDQSVLFVYQDRPAPGVRLLELPRGKAEPRESDFIQIAARETLEETGYKVKNARSLGKIYPDSGIQAASIEVIQAEHDSMTQRVDIVDRLETVGYTWIPQAKIANYIASGDIRDAITLSAIQLWDSYKTINRYN